MYKYKYMSYPHESGDVARGDSVAAFTPTHVGRKVAVAEVVGINANTIRVKYEFKGETYETTLKDHQWCLHLTKEEADKMDKEWEKLDVL